MRTIFTCSKSTLFYQWRCRIVVLACYVSALFQIDGFSACVAPPSGLVSWWSGDEHGRDLIGFNPGALRFGTAYTDGKVGKAFLFDGVDDRVDARTWGMTVFSRDFSIAGWIKTSATRERSTVLVFDPAGPALVVTGPGGFLQLSPASPSTSGGFNDGQFHHFAVTRKNGSIQYFKDGLPIGTASLTGNIAQNRFVIGSDGTASQSFAGAIDEILFFNRELSSAEVAAQFNAGSDGYCKPALRPLSIFIEAEDFDFNGGQHLSAVDSMPHLGGGYETNQGLPEIDFHDPGSAESASYRPGGPATLSNGDVYRDGYDLLSNFAVGWNDIGDWYNYTRTFPQPALDYRIYARLSSGDMSNNMRLDLVSSGIGTSNQTLLKIGEAKAAATGGWGVFQFVPVLDDLGKPVTLSLGGQKTFRLTILPGSEDINYLQFVPVPPASTNNCVPLPAGAVAWWSGDQSAVDTKGTNGGVLMKGATFVPGKVNDAIFFDGVDDYAETLLDINPSALKNTTWEAWVFPTRPAYWRQQILCADDGGYDRSLLLEGGAFGVFTGGNTWYPAPISFNQWQHVVVIFSETNTLFYKDGVEFSMNESSIGGGTGFRLNIGRNPGFGEYFQGLIDEVTIYDRPLTAAEIRNIYSAGSAGKCGVRPENPSLRLSSTLLNFGNVQTGKVATASLVISNAGSVSLNVTAISLESSPFSRVSPGTPFTLASGTATNLVLNYSPTAVGSNTTSLRISSNDPEQFTYIVLNGVGVAGSGPPVISKIEAPSGPPGSAIFLTGSGFGDVIAESQIRFNGQLGTVVSTTDSEMAVLVPNSLPPGAASVIVKVRDATSGPASFLVTSNAPSISMAVSRSGRDSVLSWPTNDTSWVLETTPSLTPPVVWSLATNQPVILSGRFVLKLSPGITTAFFRLGSADTLGELLPPSSSSGRGTIIAATGGSITTADASTTLLIPPGALSNDTQIEIVSINFPGESNHLPGGDVLFYPEGLRFSKPATLIVKGPVNPPTDAMLEIQQLSLENTPKFLGSEGSYFESVTDFQRNAATGELSIPINHFSGTIWSWWAKWVYLVIDLPARYLKKGDLIYVLTDATSGQGGSWNPGHCGMYMGTSNAFDTVNNEKTIIESTTTNALFQGSVRFDDFDTFNGFKKLAGGHIFLGARRPSLFDVSDGQRNEIARWAMIHEAAHTPYSLVGGPFLYSGKAIGDGLTCVGLNESAYEFATGKRIVPWQAARFLLTPLRQFVLTRPINDAEIEVGEDFNFKVIGVVNTGTIRSDYHTRDDLSFRYLDVASCNPDAQAVIFAKRANFFDFNGLFTFKPSIEDVGKTFRFAFTVNAQHQNRDKVSTIFTVKVKPASIVFVRQDPPAIFVESQFYSGDLVVTNTGAYVTGPSGQLWLRWETPPATLKSGDRPLFSFTPDPTTSQPIASYSSTSPASPRSLFGDLNRIVYRTDSSVSYVGYTAQEPTCPNFGRCYSLSSFPITREITVGENEFTITFNVTAYGGLTYGGPGERRGSVVWTYKRK